ncbi:hypothetical protein JXA85_08960 [Candidatus Woesearchaeota archaeon]|nr:hypothetical protein [Candidatus Woesearchaeota archaeon]
MAKSGKIKEEYVTVCPKCKSPDIRIDKSNPVQPIAGLPAMYLCAKCGHSGYNFPEVLVSEIEKFEKESVKEKIIDTKKDKTPFVDTNYGNFEVRVLWKVTGPLFLLLGLVAFVLKRPTEGSTLLIVGAFITFITYFKKRKIKNE